MKKLAFPAKVLGLIAMLPLVVILELNHGVTSLPGVHSRTNDVEQSEKTVDQPATPTPVINAYSSSFEPISFTKTF